MCKKRENLVQKNLGGPMCLFWAFWSAFGPPGNIPKYQIHWQTLSIIYNTQIYNTADAGIHIRVLPGGRLLQMAAARPDYHTTLTWPGSQCCDSDDDGDDAMMMRWWQWWCLLNLAWITLLCNLSNTFFHKIMFWKILTKFWSPLIGTNAQLFLKIWNGGSPCKW